MSALEINPSTGNDNKDEADLTFGRWYFNLKMNYDLSG